MKFQSRLKFHFIGVPLGDLVLCGLSLSSGHTLFANTANGGLFKA